MALLYFLVCLGVSLSFISHFLAFLLFVLFYSFKSTHTITHTLTHTLPPAGLVECVFHSSKCRVISEVSLEYGEPNQLRPAHGTGSVIPPSFFTSF